MSKKSKSNTQDVGHRIRGHAYVGIPSATNSSGLFTTTRYEIDTDLTSQWMQLGGLFQKWKIHRLRFEFVPIQSISAVGAVWMCIVEDPDSATPTNQATLLDQRVSAVYRYSYLQKMILDYEPSKSGWMYTRDGGISDDRFEMPGDFVFASSDFTSSVSPGYIVMEYDISFAALTNSTVSISKSLARDSPQQTANSEKQSYTWDDAVEEIRLKKRLEELQSIKAKIINSSNSTAS